MIIGLRYNNEDLFDIEIYDKEDGTVRIDPYVYIGIYSKFLLSVDEDIQIPIVVDFVYLQETIPEKIYNADDIDKEDIIKVYKDKMKEMCEKYNLKITEC